jgi:hypothetical protein
MSEDKSLEEQIREIESQIATLRFNKKYLTKAKEMEKFIQNSKHHNIITKYFENHGRSDYAMKEETTDRIGPRFWISLGEIHKDFPKSKKITYGSLMVEGKYSSFPALLRAFKEKYEREIKELQEEMEDCKFLVEFCEKVIKETEE